MCIYLDHRKRARDGRFTGISSCDKYLRFQIRPEMSAMDDGQRICSPSCRTPYNLPVNSPVSPRVLNLKEDMDVLTLSRQDNPYISSKLELLSNSCGSGGGGDDVLTMRQQLSSPNSIHYSISLNRDSVGDASQSLLWSDEDGNEEGRSSTDLLDSESHLHDFLVRSPPPQFPTTICAFAFPEPGSPLHSITLREHECPDGQRESAMTPEQ